MKVYVYILVLLLSSLSLSLSIMQRGGGGGISRVSACTERGGDDVILHDVILFTRAGTTATCF